MEATPSLACANKCVFCWRHHKNPVGREWRWKTDDPFFIVKEAIRIVSAGEAVRRKAECSGRGARVGVGVGVGEVFPPPQTK